MSSSTAPRTDTGLAHAARLELERQADELSDYDLLELHRHVSRRAAGIYAELHHDRYKMGVAAARCRDSRLSVLASQQREREPVNGAPGRSSMAAA